MYFSATFDLPNGATATVGRVSAINSASDGSTSIAINYYTDLAATVVLWQSTYTIPASVLTSGTYPDNIYAYLIGGTGPLTGASMLNDNSAALEDVREAKWSEIKAYRDGVEFGGCVTDLGTIDSDEVSQQRVTSTLAFANLVGTSFGVGWTMADNTVIFHNYAAFQTLALELGQHVSNAHSRAQSLRDKLNLLDTVTDIQAFDVPTQWLNLSLLTEDGYVLLTQAGIELVA